MNIVVGLRLKLEPIIAEDVDPTTRIPTARELVLDTKIYSFEEALDVVRRYFRAFEEMEK